MSLTFSSRSLKVLPLVLSVGLTLISGYATRAQAQSSTSQYSLPDHWKISQAFKPPNRGTPKSTVGGATRGGCTPTGQSIVSLMPDTKLGLTFSEHPTFFWYVPAMSAQTAEFLLMGSDDTEVVYQATITLSQAPGIVSFKLPANVAPALQSGKTYHWYLSIACNPEDTNSIAASVEGWVERTAPSPDLLKRLNKAAERDRPVMYAEAGIWHEAITALANLRQSNPNNAKINSDWQEMLKSIGLNQIVDQPLVHAAQPRE